MDLNAAIMMRRVMNSCGFRDQQELSKVYICPKVVSIQRYKVLCVRMARFTNAISNDVDITCLALILGILADS